MTKTYTNKSNARRAARQRGLDACTAVVAVADGFQVVAPPPAGWDKVDTSNELTHVVPEPTKSEVDYRSGEGDLRRR
jgi:hypothetical protein